MNNSKTICEKIYDPPELTSEFNFTLTLFFGKALFDAMDQPSSRFIINQYLAITHTKKKSYQHGNPPIN